MLTKIGDDQPLQDNELQLIETRFYSKDEADRKCPDGIRLFFDNISVITYNNSILNSAVTK